MQETISDWLYEETLEPFLIVLAGLVKYDFDDMDWDTIESGISKTSVDQSIWYEYVFLGEQAAKVKLAHADGCCLYECVLELPAELKEKMEFGLSILKQFKLGMYNSNQ